MAWLEGSLERVLWASDRSGYAVVRVQTADGPVIAVGTLASLAGQAEGAFVALEGQFESHPVHGHQFRTTGLLDASPHTLAGLQIWLASAGVKGIGKALAGKLVDRFGMELVSVIRDHPERLREVSGVGEARVAAIREAWSADEDSRALTILLRGLGLSQRLADRIRERYGERARHVVTAEPFRLAEEIGGIGFRTADALARTQGLPEDDPSRVRAAALHALDQASDHGHCFLDRAALRRAVDALGVPTHGLDDAVASAEGAGRLVVDPAPGGGADRIYASALYFAEVQIARELGTLAEVQVADPPDEAAIADAERWVKVALDPSQREAVVRALSTAVSVITGGPGTGKTTLLRVPLRVLIEAGADVKLASPTGRAARRLEEATGAPAQTLHRLLAFDPSTNRFGRCFGDPLEGDVVIVDEASMIDAPLMAALLDALPTDNPRLSLVLVGDVDQLPSVGAGQVLRDVIDSGVVPVARLRTLHRQAADSGLIPAARAVLEGRPPGQGDGVGTDVFLLARPAAADALDTVLKVVAERLPANGYEPRTDVQVLAPTRRGPLGTERLNAELQARLNPDGPGLTRGERTFRVGDRVICTRNRYDVEVFNGDTGLVSAADEAGLTVSFDGKAVRWERDDLGMLDLAYAITVHKSQGSEYPAVVVALHDVHSIMLRRNLFYTAITRPRRFLCVVGSPTAWARAARSTGGDERSTALAERLRARLRDDG